MATQSLNHLVSQGLAAVQAGSKIGRQATSEIQRDVTDPQLKQMLQQGEQHTQQWDQRLEQVEQMMGGGSESSQEREGNAIVAAIHDVSKKIRQNAQDATERDLGIIAAGQLALHYYIASFGTIGAYCEDLGKNDAAQLLKQCVEEAKQADEMHTQLAQRIARGS